jgi:hypothetical protein
MDLELVVIVRCMRLESRWSKIWFGFGSRDLGPSRLLHKAREPRMPGEICMQTVTHQ